MLKRWMTTAEPLMRREMLVPPSLPQHMNKLDNAFAVVMVGGRQFKVSPNDRIVSEKLSVPVGERIRLRKVLMIGTPDYTLVGKPVLDQCTIEATVEEQARSEKVVIFKKKRRKGYQRTRGHRSDITILRINAILEGSSESVEKMVHAP